jgi:hypothetical protein
MVCSREKTPHQRLPCLYLTGKECLPRPRLRPLPRPLPLSCPNRSLALSLLGPRCRIPFVSARQGALPKPGFRDVVARGARLFAASALQEFLPVGLFLPQLPILRSAPALPTRPPTGPSYPLSHSLRLSRSVILAHRLDPPAPARRRTLHPCFARLAWQPRAP